MVKIEDFKEFYQKSQELFLEHPARTRYTIKFRPDVQILRIKVTDDNVTYTYETESYPDVKLVDNLNTAMFKLMSCPKLDYETVSKLLQADAEVPTDTHSQVQQTTENTSKPKSKQRKA